MVFRECMFVEIDYSLAIRVDIGTYRMVEKNMVVDTLGMVVALLVGGNHIGDSIVAFVLLVLGNNIVLLMNSVGIVVVGYSSCSHIVVNMIVVNMYIAMDINLIVVLLVGHIELDIAVHHMDNLVVDYFEDS